MCHFFFSVKCEGPYTVEFQWLENDGSFTTAFSNLFLGTLEKILHVEENRKDIPIMPPDLAL